MTRFGHEKSVSAHQQWFHHWFRWFIAVDFAVTRKNACKMHALLSSGTLSLYTCLVCPPHDFVRWKWNALFELVITSLTELFVLLFWMLSRFESNFTLLRILLLCYDKNNSSKISNHIELIIYIICQWTPNPFSLCFLWILLAVHRYVKFFPTTHS